MIHTLLKKKNNHHKKNIQKKYLLNSLFQSKNFYGESLNLTKKENFAFLYGVRHGYAIIDLKTTTFFFKKALILIQSYFYQNKKVLIIGDSFDMNFLLNTQYIKKNKNIYFFNEEWINGSLTNSLLLKKKNYDLIIVLKSDIKEQYLLTEIFNIKTPVIFFSNTNTNLKTINYPIMSNTKNIKSIFLFMYLIRNLI